MTLDIKKAHNIMCWFPPSTCEIFATSETIKVKGNLMLYIIGSYTDVMYNRLWL